MKTSHITAKNRGLVLMNIWSVSNKSYILWTEKMRWSPTAPTLLINTFSNIDRVPIGVLLNGTCRTRFLLLL